MQKKEFWLKLKQSDYSFIQTKTMQIKSVFISNIGSFPYTEDRSKTIFFNTEWQSWVNILIWPNGSGKTNFLKTIKTVVSHWLILDLYIDTQTEIKKNTICTNQIAEYKALEAHFTDIDKASFVCINTKVCGNDKDNLLFLQKQRVTINQIIEQYSTIWYQIPEINKEEINRIEHISIDFEVNTKNQKISAFYKGTNKAEQFVFDFLRYEELFHLCISIYNEKVKKESELGRYPLKNTFSYLDSKRDFDKIQDIHLNHKAWEHYVGKKNNTSSNFPWYALCIRKIRDIIHHNSEENYQENKPENELSQDYINIKLNDSNFFKNLKESIKKYLELDLQIKYHGENIEFVFTDEDGINHSIHALSHGEQSLLVILFSIYGNDLKDGLIIIDEPEMHFHPQIQRRLSRLLEKLSVSCGTQCIISTYSPIFINEKNISNVYRFNKIWGNTKVKNPGNTIWEWESSLIQILKFENASKIFFVDKIIMVEWEIDAYFFEFYLEYLHTFEEWKPYLKDYEIININGKWSYKKRYKFLKKFDIDAFFIGDRDNIVDYWFVTQSDLAYFYKQSKRHRNTHNSGERHYTKLVNTVKDIFPNKYNEIIKHIMNLYKENVFILQRWDIETYLGMKSKGLEETIEFCHNFFDSWLKNEELKEHKAELNKIIAMIFNKPINETNTQEEPWETKKVKEEKKTEESTPIPSFNKEKGDILIWHHTTFSQI